MATDGPKPKLSPKQARFVAEYLIDLNATQAAIRAGYSPRTAYAIGAENLTKPDIAAAIMAAQADRAKRVQIDQDRVLLELARIGFSSMRDFATWGSQSISLRDSTALTDDQVACVAELGAKPGKFGSELRFKLHDKVAALGMIARHLGMFVEQHVHTIKDADTLSDAELAKIAAQGKADLPALKASTLKEHPKRKR